MSANSHQVAGDHYKSGFQHWDWVIGIYLPYLPAQVSKYIIRWKKKNGLQDLQKAKHFLDKFIEDEEQRTANIVLLTDRFLEENYIGEAESHIINDMMAHHIGSVAHLRKASKVLNLLIAQESGS